LPKKQRKTLGATFLPHPGHWQYACQLSIFPVQIIYHITSYHILHKWQFSGKNWYASAHGPRDSQFRCLSYNSVQIEDVL